MKVVVLDAGPVGMITNPRATAQNEACRAWVAALLESGLEVMLPEIVDYEVRRELLRARKTEGIDRLNRLKDILQYVPLTTGVMLRAAELWALARQQGKPTAKDDSLDGDVILAAQALSLAEDPDDVVVATTNSAHLARFVLAKEWAQI